MGRVGQERRPSRAGWSKVLLGQGFLDIAAIGAIHAARARGLRAPEDISVTGFVDFPTARYVVPQLTKVAQPIRVLGRQAVVEQLSLIGGRDTPFTPPEDLGLQLVLRQTTQHVGSTPIR